MNAFVMSLGISRKDAIRWGACFAAVFAAHSAVALALLLKPPSDDEFGVESSVVMVDLPESLLLLTAPPTNLAPGPKEEEQEEEKPKEETKPPEPEAEVALPKPEPEVVPQEVKPATAPVSSVPTASAIRRWESDLVAHIEHFKRYPVEARNRGEQGLARVAFSIDRDGWGRTSRIVQSSGSPELDQEALAMLTRAQPMPHPPDNVPSRELFFAVPVRFNIR